MNNCLITTASSYNTHHRPLLLYKCKQHRCTAGELSLFMWISLHFVCVCPSLAMFSGGILLNSFGTRILLPVARNCSISIVSEKKQDDFKRFCMLFDNVNNGLKVISYRFCIYILNAMHIDRAKKKLIWIAHIHLCKASSFEDGETAQGQETSGISWIDRGLSLGKWVHQKCMCAVM